jgi:hypothetical protein
MLDWTRREREEREADGEEITGENDLPPGDDGHDGAPVDEGQDAA